MQNTTTLRGLALAGMLAIQAALFALDWPVHFGLIEHCFLDRGSFRMLDALWTAESLPGRDFGYSYGLIPLVVQRGWYALFGNSVAAFVALDMVLQTALVSLLGYLVLWKLRASAVVCFAAVCIAPVLTNAPAVSPAHGLLKLCLATALTLLASGQSAWALAVLTVAVFLIPSLPYLAIALLGGWLLWRMPRGGAFGEQIQYLWRQFAPALAMGITLFCLGVATFGTHVTLASLWPGEGAAMYKAMNFGFFRDGMNFWAPAGASVKYYLGSLAGIWIACSLFIVGVGVWLVKQWRTLADKSVLVVFLSCLALHLGFVLLAYGNAPSHIYYDFLLATGTLAGLQLLPTRRAWPIALCLGGMALLATTILVRPVLRHRPQFAVTPASRGLYVSAQLAPLWEEIVDLAGKNRVFALSYGNGAPLTFPEIQASRSWFLLPHITTPGEHATLMHQLRNAQYVVLVRAGGMQYINENLEIQAELDCMQPVRSAAQVQLFRRDSECSLTGGK